MDERELRRRETERIKSNFPEFDFAGIEVGPGWFPLVEEFFTYARSNLTAGEREAFGRVSFKEKYGQLRVEGAYPASLEDKVEEIEDRSEETCEVCGMPGRPRDSGWIRTLCDKHAA